MTNLNDNMMPPARADEFAYAALNQEHDPSLGRCIEAVQRMKGSVAGATCLNGNP